MAIVVQRSYYFVAIRLIIVYIGDSMMEGRIT